MKRNLKALGLAMVAVFALSAMAASSAQAVVEHHLTTTGNTKAIITAEDEPETKTIFKTGGGEVKCEEALYEGTTTAETSTELTVTPTYGGCTFNGGAATVTVNHCAYILTGNTNASEDAEVHVECAVGSQIEITFKVFGTTCTIDIGEQTRSGLHYTQTGNGTTIKHDITVKSTVSGITYTKTGGFACNFIGNGADGQLNGELTGKAYEDKCAEGLKETGRTTPGTHYTSCEGAQINLTLTTT